MKAERLKYDFAYGCFLLSGMSALLITVIGKTAKDDNTSALLGFFVAIPLAFASFAAIVAALVLSIMLRHWPLLILSALTVLSVAVVAMVHGSEAFYNSAAIPLRCCCRRHDRTVVSGSEKKALSGGCGGVITPSNKISNSLTPAPISGQLHLISFYCVMHHRSRRRTVGAICRQQTLESMLRPPG